MKSLGRRLIDFLVGHDALWRLMNASLLRVARYAESSRREKVASEVGAREISRLIPDLTVRHGPFRGMRFPDTESTTGCLFPMILGSYERELHPLIERIVATPYTEIVNMGCGEGYYAVGLAMRIPTAMVLGYDIDSAATRLCRRLAEFNGVGSRVVVKDNCDGALFVHQDFRRGGLVVSDREGCELQLFTERSVETLANTDVLIEVHDTLDLRTPTILGERFSKTHQLEIISSVDDIKRVRAYEYKELVSYDLEERLILLSERRGAAMDWFFFTPK